MYVHLSTPSSLDRLVLTSYKPEIKVLQIQLTGFLDKDTPKFCKELWNLCLSAQTSPQGVPKELLEAKKLELIQEKVRLADGSAHEQSADSCRSMQNGLQKKRAFVKSKKEQGSEMWTQFDNESETNAVAAEGEAVGEAVDRFMTGAQVIQGHLHDEETRRAVLHHQDEMWTPTFRLEEAIEELVLEAGLVPDQFRAQYQGPLLDRDLHFHTARRLSAPSGQDLLLVQGHQRSSGRDCQAVPFHQSGVALRKRGGALFHVVKIVHDLTHVLTRHAHDRLEDVEGHHPTLRIAEVHRRPASVVIIEGDHIRGLCQGHHRGKGCGGARAETVDPEDLPPLIQMFTEEINVLISSRIAPIETTAG